MCLACSVVQATLLGLCNCGPIYLLLNPTGRLDLGLPQEASQQWQHLLNQGRRRPSAQQALQAPVPLATCLMSRASSAAPLDLNLGIGNGSFIGGLSRLPDNGARNIFNSISTSLRCLNDYHFDPASRLHAISQRYHFDPTSLLLRLR